LSSSLKCNQAEVQAFHDARFDLSCQLHGAFSIALNVRWILDPLPRILYSFPHTLISTSLLQLPKTYFRQRHRSGANGLAFINCTLLPSPPLSFAHRLLRQTLPSLLVLISKALQASRALRRIRTGYEDRILAPFFPGSLLVTQGSLTLLFREESGTPGLEVFLPDAAVEASKPATPMQPICEADLEKGEWGPRDARR
jgi:hypothetical protein